MGTAWAGESWMAEVSGVNVFKITFDQLKWRWSAALRRWPAIERRVPIGFILHRFGLSSHRLWRFQIVCSCRRSVVQKHVGLIKVMVHDRDRQSDNC